MLKRALLAVAVVVALAGVGATPAQAIPIGPDNTMIIYNFYNSGGSLVGQKWRCPYGGGEWGDVSGQPHLAFGVC